MTESLATDWRLIALKMAHAVDVCCGCNYYSDLTEDERTTLRTAIEQRGEE